jgi:hypothetical protein
MLLGMSLDTVRGTADAVTEEMPLGKLLGMLLGILLGISLGNTERRSLGVLALGASDGTKVDTVERSLLTLSLDESLGVPLSLVTLGGDIDGVAFIGILVGLDEGNKDG